MHARTTPPDPISPYGVAKLAAERYCVSFSRVYHSFETVVLRYFNVFGPRQSPHSQYAAVVPLFLTAIARGEPVTIYGDGEQSRDFTYVDNVVDATLRAADADGANGRIFNVAAGSPASVERRSPTTIGAHRSASPSRSATGRRAPATSATRGPTSSAARERSAGEPTIGLEEGLRRTAEPPRLAEPIRVLRVIARLNMGGPALHVAYLSAGLQERGYETTLVAGELARGEESMAFVAEERGVEVLAVSQLHREISPLRDLVAAFRLAGLIRKLRPHIVHTHTAKAGAVGRVAALLAGVRPRPIVVHTFHGHVLRGYFGPLQDERLPPARAPPRARDGRPRRRQPAGARRPRRARRRAGGAVRRRPARDRARRARRRRRRRATPDAAAARRPGRPLRRRLDRPDDRRQAHATTCCSRSRELRDRGVDATLCLVGDGPDRERPRGARATSSGSRATSSRSATRTTSRTGTPPSTRSSSRRRTRARR